MAQLCIALAVGMLAAMFGAASLGAAETPQSPPLYHPGRDHLWNRLHHAFFVRLGPDGRVYGEDRLEPLLWPGSKHLLEPECCEQAARLLEEFLEQQGERLVDDRLKRAVLQRDLWLVFNWLEGNHAGFAEPEPDTKALAAARRRLRGSLAAVIGRLALSSSEIEELPDNYRAAAASGRFAAQFDPEQPERPFLPVDLFAPDGPWVCVGRSDGPTAPEHLREDGTNRFTNSVFLVFLRLPSGREETIEYLQRLRAFRQPLLLGNPDDAGKGLFPRVPNPQLPQFPPGTQVALVRQALLIDSSDRIKASPLTESIQLRVIHGDPPAVTTDVLNDAFSTTVAAIERGSLWQSFYEVRLSRAQLLAGEAGGLRPIGPDERDFKTGFGAHAWDELEQPLEAFRRSRAFAVRQTCFVCHSLPGVYSFNSLQDFRSGIASQGDRLSPHLLSEMPVSQVLKAAIAWKEDRPSWAALRELLEEQSGVEE